MFVAAAVVPIPNWSMRMLFDIAPPLVPHITSQLVNTNPTV
jgi:hypothetical protein